jgi:hypothetical protein
MEATIHQVEKIVNQTVPAYRRSEGMHVGKFSPGWFHEGAIKPDFNQVDVRATRETAEYEKSEYCTSDLNPGLVWRGRDLEFNSMTKYFYTNRTFRKKKLTGPRCSKSIVSIESSATARNSCIPLRSPMRTPAPMLQPRAALDGN